MSNKLQIKFFSYDVKLLENSVVSLINLLKSEEKTFSGPIPLPTDKEIITVIRSVHKFKDSREQFEIRTHKRLLIIKDITESFIEKINMLELPPSVNLNIKII